MSEEGHPAFEVAGPMPRADDEMTTMQRTADPVVVEPPADTEVAEGERKTQDVRVASGGGVHQRP